MANLGFTRIDFEVFTVPGFNERMQQIYMRVRPKLLKLGDDLAPELERKLRLEFFPHVARHARRTVNPPPETWAAFGPSPRGYKRYGYLALCISSLGLQARAVIKSEADGRPAIAETLKAHARQLMQDFQGSPLARYDKWDFSLLPAGQRVELGLLETLAQNLTRKTGGLDVGFGWNLARSLRLSRADLLDAFSELAPLYRLLRQAA